MVTQDFSKWDALRENFFQEVFPQTPFQELYDMMFDLSMVGDGVSPANTAKQKK